VAEDRESVDARDRPVRLDPEGLVTLPHRLDLGLQALDEWTRALADYEILQPFPQLAREVHHPTPEERAAKDLERFHGLKVHSRRLLGLERRGWVRGGVEAGAAIWQFYRALPGPDAEAEVWIEPGISVLRTAESGEQTVRLVRVRRPGREDATGLLRMGELDPMLFRSWRRT